MCTQIERGKRNSSKLNKAQWNKWDDKSYKLNRSYVHQMFVCKVTAKHKFFYNYTNLTIQLLGHINVLNPRGIKFRV
jgi:hypothetical protein